MTLEEAQLAKLELICEQARPATRRPPARDRDRLGRPRASTPRRRAAAASRPRRSRASSTTTPSRASAAPEWRTASRSCCEDYRDLTGRYDKLVSIEMIEAVGWRHLGAFFAKCSELLAPGRRDAASGDRDRRSRLRGREGLAVVHQHAHLPRRLPALARGDRARRRPPHRHADGAPRGPDPALRRDAPALAGATSSAAAGALAASATTSGSGACGRSTSPTARPASPSAGSSTFSSSLAKPPAASVRRSRSRMSSRQGWRCPSTAAETV